MSIVGKLRSAEILEIIESLLNISTRKEAEIAELKAQLDIYKPRDAKLKIFDSPSHNIKGKVVLVFQSRNLREIIKILLERNQQFDVLLIDKYEDAVSACAIQHPEICVFELSKMYNYSLQIDILKELKINHVNMGLVTVLYENDVSLIRDIVTAGSDDFLVKPIDTTRLVKVISDILSKNREKIAV